jgi:hypothetical protein
MLLCLCLSATLAFSACDVDDDDNEDGVPDDKMGTEQVQ